MRDGAHVTEITTLVDVAAYPLGTRVLVRREPLHPGAQQTFDDIDGHRYTALLTTQPDTGLAELDRRHRAHARVEQRIRDAKATGLGNLPSADAAINQIWLQLVLIAQDLLAWLAALALDGDLAVAAPPPCATGCCTSPDGSPTAAAGRPCTSTPPGHGPSTWPRRSEDSGRCPRPRNRHPTAGRPAPRRGDTTTPSNLQHATDQTSPAPPQPPPPRTTQSADDKRTVVRPVKNQG